MSEEKTEKSVHNDYQDERIEGLEESYKALNHNSQKMRIDIEVIKTKLARHEKLLWLILALVLSAAVKLLIFG